MNEKQAKTDWQEVLRKYLAGGVGVGLSYGGITALLRQLENINEDKRRKAELRESEEDSIVITMPPKKADMSTAVIGWPVAVGGAFMSAKAVKELAHRIRLKQLKREADKQKERYYKALSGDEKAASEIINPYIPDIDTSRFPKAYEKRALPEWLEQIGAMGMLAGLSGMVGTSEVVKRILDRELRDSQERESVKQPVRKIVFRYMPEKTNTPELVAVDDEKEASYKPLNDYEKAATLLSVETVYHYMKTGENIWEKAAMEKNASYKPGSDKTIADVTKALESMMKSGQEGGGFWQGLGGTFMNWIGQLMKKFPGMARTLFKNVGKRYLQLKARKPVEDPNIFQKGWGWIADRVPGDLPRSKAEAGLNVLEKDPTKAYNVFKQTYSDTTKHPVIGQFFKATGPDYNPFAKANK